MRENEQILMMKGHMKDMVDAMRPDNAEACFNVLTTQFETLRQLYAIESMKASAGLLGASEDACAAQEAAEPSPEPEPEVEVNEPDEPVRQAESAEKETLQEQKQVMEQPQPVKVREMYRIVRKLKGAFVPDIEGFIPEIVLRDMDLDHGDYVYATPVPSLKPGQKRYEYELAKKSDEKLPSDRVEYRGCPIEKDGRLLVVTKSSATGEKIRVNDAPYAILIRDNDIDQHHLKEGDVVDIAFYRDKPEAASVVWKHDTWDGGASDRQERKRAGRSRQVTVRSSVEQVFEGKTICIAGDKPNEAGYRALIEERGGTHLHIEPRWGIDRIENIVKKADVVVGLYDLSKHTGLEKVKEYCKAYDVPYEMISGRGKSKAVQTAVRLLGEPVMS